MSLMVWLPFNGNLNNHGLSQITVTGGTVDNNGKIGKCYLVSKTAPITITQNLPSTSEWSIAFWAKLPASMNNATAWETMFSFPTINADTGSNGISNISWASYHNIKIYDDANHQWLWAAPGTHFNYDVWYHWTITHTLNGNGVQGKIYINGNLIGTYNNTTHQMKIRSGNISIGNGISTGGFYINDFRIYDHTLSPLEVKHLAQGLVLHYPLSDSSNDAKENLVPSNYWVGTKTVSLSANTTNYGIINYPTINVKTNTTYFWSIDIRVVSGGDNLKSMAIDTNCTGGSYTGNDSAHTVVTAQHPNLAELKAGKWQTAYCITTVKSDATNPKIFHSIYGQSSTNVSLVVEWKNLTLVESNEVVPFRTQRSDVVYDVSGFGNNGTINGELSVSDDSPRYDISTKFNGSDSGILIDNLYLSNIINTAVTYSFWIKPSGENGARSVYFGSYSGNSWSIEKTSSNLIRGYWNGNPDISYSGATIVDNIWQHVCITKNGTSDVKVYINGELKASSTATHNNLSFPTTYRIGRDVRSGDGTPYKGLMSDFRIYATALSEEDVLELYHTPISLTSSGTLMTQGEYVEV